MTARGALTVVGQVVGGYFGPAGAAVGGAIGGFIGGEIDGPQSAQGPRITDLKITTSSYGTPIPYVEGHPRISGNIIWASSKREIATTTNQGGKGSDTTTDVTTYTYEIDLLILLTANPIAGVTRIWSNSKLVYSTLASSNAQTLIASQTAPEWSELIVYTGGASQLPDPTYEAAVGAGNAPAYRTRGTLMLRGLQLGGSGQMPNLTFEVASSVVAADTTNTVATDSAIWDASFGPVVADALGATVHCGLWKIGVANAAVNIVRYGLDGSVSIIGGYSVTTSGLDVAPNIPHGNADVPCLLMHAASPDANTVYKLYEGEAATLGATFTLDLGDNLGNYACRYSYRGGVLVLGGGGGGSFSTSKKIYKVIAGNVVATSAAMATYIRNIVICADAVYALETGTSLSIYKLNSSTLALEATLTAPGTGVTTASVLVDDDGVLCYANSTTLYRWTGAAWLAIAASLGNAGIAPNGVATVIVGSYDIAGTSLFAYEAPTQTTRALYVNVQTITPTTETLANVASRLCLRAGLTAPQFNVTALASKNVNGFAIGQLSTTRQVLELLSGAYLFEAVESAGVLKFVLRGGASVATIPYASMGASLSNPEEPLPVNRRNDDEAPKQCVIRYINAADDYQDGSESSDRLVGYGTGVQVIEVPAALTPAQAKALADVAIMDIAARALSIGPIGLSRDYAIVEPTDVITVTDVDGSTFRARVVKLTESGGLRTVEAVLDNASILTSVAGTTSTGYTDSTSIAAQADTVLQLMDIAILRDADNNVGFYAAAKGSSSAYAGSRLYGGLDGITYTERETFTESAVIGTCTTTLGNYSGANVFDWANSLTVDVGAGVLASETRDNLLTLGANAALVGNNEIIQFLTSTLVSSGVYTLTGLLRGRRGTEWAMTGHAAAERFVLLQLTGLRRIANTTDEIGALRYYKGVTFGRSLGTATQKTLTNSAAGLKPWAPVDLRGSRDASANLIITWSRRTRLATNFTSGTVPLGEAAESYAIEVYSSNTFVTLKRTITSTTPTASYLASEQTTDFGAAQATVWVKVYQVSSIVGRGYALQGGV